MMSKSADLERITRGLADRLTIALAVAKHDAALLEKHKNQDLSVAALKERYGELKNEIPSLDVARVSLKFLSVADQLRFLKQFDDSIFKLASLLTVGASFEDDHQTNALIGDCDYSLIYLGPALVQHPERYKSISNIVRDFLEQLISSIPENTPFSAPMVQLSFLRTSTTDDLRAISLLAQRLKQLWWPILGPDLLSVIQAMCDPLHLLKLDQLTTAYELAQLWGVETVFSRLALLRALGGFDSERRFVLAHLADFRREELLRPDIHRAACSLLSDAGKHEELMPFLKNRSNDDHLMKLLTFSLNVAVAITTKNLKALKHHVLAVYNLDPLACYMIDWDRIHRTFLLPANEADLASIFMKMIMSSAIIGRRFLSIAVARGRGQVVADLSSYVLRLRTGRDSSVTDQPANRTPSRSRARGTYDFVRGMRALPTRVRSRLMEEVLDKGMIERLAFAFPKALTLPVGPTRKDNQPSTLRIELANLAKRERILDEKRAFRILDEETQFLRMHYFHTFFKAGRVKVDWDYLAYMVANTIERQFSFLLSDTAEPNVHTLVFKNVVELFAQEIADILLFDSEASLDQALSNNLRHGVIVPRFLKVLNDSLEWSGPLIDFNEAANARFGSDAKHILELREVISNRVNSFKDFWLTVDRSGPFCMQTRRAVTSALMETQGKRKDTDSWRLAESVVQNFQISVESIIADMLAHFRSEVQPDLEAAIQTARKNCAADHSDKTTSFFDLLETNIQSASEEVAGWLGLSKFGLDVDDFELMDLIKFESVSFILADFKKLNVRYLSLRKTESGPQRIQRDHRLRGHYFEAAQEIVHNLISNAFKYSGLGVNTEVIFSVIRDSSDLIFRCENNFAEAMQEQVQTQRENARKIIRQERPEKAKDDDVLSGFHKIKNICSRVFGCDVVINVPPISAKQPRFVIEITIEGVADDALADEQVIAA